MCNPELKDRYVNPDNDFHYLSPAEIANLSHAEQLLYRERLKDHWDFFSVTETAEKKGEAKGLAKGLAKGHAKGLKEGLVKGRAEGRAEGMEEGMVKGRAEGMEEGMVKGRAEGMEEGMVKGRAEGETLKALAIARQMRQAGLPIAQVAQFTGLSESEIADL